MQKRDGSAVIEERDELTPTTGFQGGIYVCVRVTTLLDVIGLNNWGTVQLTRTLVLQPLPHRDTLPAVHSIAAAGQRLHHDPGTGDRLQVVQG